MPYLCIIYLTASYLCHGRIQVARSREKNCADRAKYLLDEMGRLYNEGDTELVPHAVSFGAIINAVSSTKCFIFNVICIDHHFLQLLISMPILEKKEHQTKQLSFSCIWKASTS